MKITIGDFVFIGIFLLIGLYVAYQDYHYYVLDYDSQVIMGEVIDSPPRYPLNNTPHHQLLRRRGGDLNPLECIVSYRYETMIGDQKKTITTEGPVVVSMCNIPRGEVAISIDPNDPTISRIKNTSPDEVLPGENNLPLFNAIGLAGIVVGIRMVRMLRKRNKANEPVREK